MSPQKLVPEPPDDAFLRDPGHVAYKGAGGFGVLIRMETGDPTMRQLTYWQKGVREYIAESVHYELMAEAVRIYPEEVLRISSSIAVNPWQEVIEFVADNPVTGAAAAASLGGSLAVVGKAVYTGLKNANEILDFVIRVSNVRDERRAARERLRRAATEDRSAIVREVFGAIDAYYKWLDIDEPDEDDMPRSMTQTQIAAEMIRHLEEVPPERLRGLSIEGIQRSDAEAIRRRALRVLRDPGASNDDQAPAPAPAPASD